MKEPRFQTKSKEHFRDLMQSGTAAIRVGRAGGGAEQEDAIWNDICRQTNLAGAVSILDVGCGCGTFVHRLVSHSEKYSAKLSLIDDAPILSQIQCRSRKVQKLSGYFPTEVTPQKIDQHFDVIIAYSVLHYLDQPTEFVMALAGLLNVGGRMLVGDIPNHSKRARMHTTVEGSNFERRYRGQPEKNQPLFASVEDYEASIESGSFGEGINDAFLLELVGRLRALGFEGFLLPQGLDLPYHYTREDLFVTRTQCLRN
jgi:2-polyprenyl-3-methyl-5-hydroxy-6-metoxy-1,4-benzoquinol methylase